MNSKNTASLLIGSNQAIYQEYISNTLPYREISWTYKAENVYIHVLFIVCNHSIVERPEKSE